MQNRALLSEKKKNEAILWGQSHREEKLSKHSENNPLKSSILSFKSAIIKLSEKLAQGIDGYVRQGINLETKNPVALKVEFTENSAPFSEPTLLENEAQILRLLDPDNSSTELLAIRRSQKQVASPAGVKIKEAGVKRYLLLDFVSGNTLKNSKECVLSWSFEDKQTVAINLLTNLQHLHTNKIVHCDLHAGNVMIDPQTKQVEIIDFGRAVAESKDQKIFDFLAALRSGGLDTRFFDDAIKSETHFIKKSSQLGINYLRRDYYSILNIFAKLQYCQPVSNQEVDLLQYYRHVLFNQNFAPLSNRALLTLNTSAHRPLQQTNLYLADTTSALHLLKQYIFTASESAKLHNIFQVLQKGDISKTIAALKNIKINAVEPTTASTQSSSPVISHTTAQPMLHYSGLPRVSVQQPLFLAQPLLMHSMYHPTQYPVLLHSQSQLHCKGLQHQRPVLVRPVF